MIIRANQEFRDGYLVFESGKVYEVEEGPGYYFVTNGWAEQVEDGDAPDELAAPIDVRDLDDDARFKLNADAKIRNAARSNGAVDLDVHDTAMGQEGGL